MVKKRIRLCFVGNINSVHLQKWVDFFSKKPEFEIFVISSHEPNKRKENVFFYEELFPRWSVKLLSRPKLSLPIRFLFFNKFLKTLKLDILHIHQLTGFSVIFAFTWFAPIIISVWGSDIRLKDSSYLRFLKKRALRKAEIVTATSRYLANQTKKMAGASLIVNVVPFGVDTEAFHPGRYKKTTNESVTIGFAKHLKPIYGADVLIRAFKKVSRKFDNIELVLAGKGETEVSLKNLVRDLGLDNKVKFVGWLSNEEVAEFLSKTDIFVMPTIVPEAFGVSAVEAGAMEVPVVASDIGGIPEVVINRRTGILVKPKNVDSLAEALGKLIADQNLRIKMGEAGRRFVKESYYWKKNAREMEQLYKNL